jgi:hypothetical protein
MVMMMMTAGGGDEVGKHTLNLSIFTFFLHCAWIREPTINFVPKHRHEPNARKKTITVVWL